MGTGGDPDGQRGGRFRYQPKSERHPEAKNEARTAYAISDSPVVTQNENQIAQEAGTSPAVIYQHYRAVNTREEG